MYVYIVLVHCLFTINFTRWKPLDLSRRVLEYDTVFTLTFHFELIPFSSIKKKQKNLAEF